MYIIGIRVLDGVVPIAWSSQKVSQKLLRKYLKKFSNDSDFIDYYQCNYERLYDNKREVKKSLPEI